MHKFVRSLITEWRKLALPFTDATLIVAVSGGADSMALLLAIHDLVTRKKLALRVVVAHFNHKLRRRESDTDEKFVREWADNLGFDFVSGSGRITRKQNLEEKAREERYEFLAAEARSAFAVQSPRKDGLTVRPTVLTGHTQNDQAETFLLNLIRGSGPEGLTAMKPVREMSENVLLVRPLLSWATRGDTEAYCRDRDADFRTDRMNDDEAFTRVRIRKTLLPLLADFNPKIVETLARTSELIQERQPAPSNDSSQPPEAAPADKLALQTLKTLSKAALYTTIRSWLRSHRGNLRSLGLKHIQSIESLVLSQKSGKTVELPGGGRVVKHGGSLTFSNIKVEK